MIKKLIILLLVSILCVCFFFGCTHLGPIPNGYYCWSSAGENIYEFTESDIRQTHGWEIKGDIAQRWTSSSIDYKAKIVEKDGKIYFEGYKWKRPFSAVESGSEVVYEGVYDETNMSITLTIV